jgi:hypothetical protein
VVADFLGWPAGSRQWPTNGLAARDPVKKNFIYIVGLCLGTGTQRKTMKRNINTIYHICIKVFNNKTSKRQK